MLIGDDDAAGGYNSQFSYTLQAGTIYYAVVTAYGRDQAGDYTLRISGPGDVNVVPNMAVIDQLGVSIPDGGNSYMTPVVVGGSTSQTYTVRNYGYTDLTGLGMTLDGANAGSFSITSAAHGSSDRTQWQHHVCHHLQPHQCRHKAGSADITSNDPNKTPFDIFLTGNGTSAILANRIDRPAANRLGQILFVADHRAQRPHCRSASRTPSRPKTDCLSPRH